MITTTSKELSDFSSKQEGKTTIEDKNNNNSKPFSSSSSTPWSRLKDPRIVRVSKAFGGKDRHSKVCTVRGLRDRRVRLSVPTAIQLYDLQDRLGLNQPSKVVDWLLKVAKHEIDELPPLPFSPLSFVQYHQQFPPNNNQGLCTSQSHREGLKINTGVGEKENWNQKSKGGEEKEEEEEREGASGSSSICNFFPGLHNNINAIPHNYFQPSIFSFSSMDDPQNLNFAQLSSAMSIAPGSHQFFVCPPPAQPYLPPSSVEFDPKQLNHLQILSSSSPQNPSNSLGPSLQSIAQTVKPLQYLSMGPKIISTGSESQPARTSDQFPRK
ncbi:hypothetical protein NMG60_11028498 [Bertholletia excelsa]